MRSRALALLPLLGVLSACDIDFVGPEILRFTKAPSASVNLDVADVPSCTPTDGSFIVPGVRTAVVCINASFFPGVNVLGEQLTFLGDTLWVQDQPLLGSEAENGTLSFQGGVRLPLSTLATTRLSIRFPRFEAAPEARGLSWYLAGRVQADTLRRAPGEPVRLEVVPPAGVSTPQANFRQWDVRITGPGGTAALFGTGVPRASYDFAASAFEQVGGGASNAAFVWTQQFFGSVGGVQTSVFATQRLRWVVITESAGGSGSGSGSGSQRTE